MITYNHENYIGQAIEGVLMQEVDFELELLVSDDCSTDKTWEIIQKLLLSHPNGSWIKSIRRDRNLGATLNFFTTISACSGDYLAFCEGDDYWTDPFKLSKQVEFMRINKDYFAVSHHVNKMNFSGEKSLIGKFEKDTFSIKDLKTRFLIIPLSSFFCRNFKTIPSWFYELYGGDAAITYLSLLNGDLKILPFVGSVYRIHSGGIEQNYKRDKYSLPKRNIKEYFLYYNNCENNLKSFYAKRLSWNYFYLLLLNLKDFHLFSSFNLLVKSTKFYVHFMFLKLLHGQDRN